ncbi:MAG: hypothetical protein Q9214_002294 [Letrouitia sp. 1 TL-2023]
MFVHPLLQAAAYVALASARALPEPEANPQLPGLPSGLAPSLTSKVLSLVGQATAAAGGVVPNVPIPSVPSIPNVGGSVPLPAAPGVTVPPLPVPTGAPGTPTLPVSIPSIGNLPVSIPGAPNLPVSAPGVPPLSVSVPPVAVPSLPVSVPGAPNVPVSVPPIPQVPSAPNLPSNPTSLLSNVTLAIQILEIVGAILGATGGSGSLDLHNLPVGLGLGSGNPLVQLLLGLVVPLITSATGIPVNHL